jgi:plasmid stabilization system protein ParE
VAIEWTAERSAAAVDDILAISGYLAAHDEKAAARFHLSVERIVTRLLDFPQSGSLREELPGESRTISFRPFLLFYRVATERHCVQIVRVLDARRDLPIIFRAFPFE